MFSKFHGNKGYVIATNNETLAKLLTVNSSPKKHFTK